ncbi:hypothetical protein ABZ783_02670 [Micromonospora sp. NPDC047738]|uniref:hypothetical protein n=1 Tax=Micromonospora sp. NPDC047738 TaxID=3155741 RepID=UPI0033FF2D23
MGNTAFSATAGHRSSDGVPAGRSSWSTATQIMVVLAMAVIGVKPFIDVFGAKVPEDTVDAGMVATVIGALLMAGAFVAVAVMSKRLPRGLTPALAALLLIGLFSVIDLLAVSARDDFLQIFTTTHVREIFGPYIRPEGGIITAAAQLAVGFAPVALLAVMLVKPEWFSLDRLRWVLLLVVIGTVVHCVIAWLQVAGVVDYTYFFNEPTGRVGRASGGYFHPASLGRLLIFAVFILYAAGDRLRLSPLARYAVLALLVATSVVSTHRITIVCVLFVIVAFEMRRLPELTRQISNLPFRTAVWGAVVLVALVIVSAIRWGAYLLDRALFVLTRVGSLNPANDEFLHGRGQIWFRVAEVWQDATPDIWLIGLGYEPWNTHLDPLRVFVVWGFLGIVLMAVVFVNLWRLTRRLVGVEARWMLTVLFALVAVNALTQKPTSYSYFMWLFFLCLMLIVASFPRVTVPGAMATEASGERK